MVKYLIAVLFIISFNAIALEQVDLDKMSRQLDVKYTLIEASATCPAHVAQCYLSELALTLPYDFVDKSWVIYFSQLMPIIHGSNQQFDITHINGDLHKISPSESFTGFIAGKAHKLRFYTQNSQITRSEFMPNYLLSDSKKVLAAKVIESTLVDEDATTGLETQPYLAPFTSLSQLRTSKNDKTPWMGPRYHFENSDQPIETNSPEGIIPKPSSMQITSDRIVDLSGGIRLALNGIKRAHISAALERMSALGVNERESGVLLDISLRKKSETRDEAYTLSVSETGINITANTSTGAFYALQSLMGLLSGKSLAVKEVEITDEPHYAFRGLHIDAARNFRSKQFVFDTIKHMASYKLNRLHLHLADDEGWRLEIDGLAELTEVGGYRCFDLSEQRCLLPQLGAGNDKGSPVNGYYSRQDYIDILRYADRHHITVIPSLDMPGHSRAAIVSMEERHRRLMVLGKHAAAQKYRLVDVDDKTLYSSIQHYNDNTLNVCLPQTYAFIDKVLDEVQRLHRQAGVPLTTYHIGADETAGAWLKSPACIDLLKGNASLNGYFIERISQMATNKGIQVAAWSDGLGDVRPEKMPPNVQSNVWGTLAEGGHVVSHEHMNRKWQVVISNPDVTYFDFPYTSHPMERGNHWATRAVDTRKVFEFMPDNLPAHAELWRNSHFHHYEARDIQSALKEGAMATGIQAHLWSEMIRTDKQAEYMLYPRLLAFAERAWHKPKWALEYKKGRIYNVSSEYFDKTAQLEKEADWQRFISILGYKELPKLAKEGVFYRVPHVAIGLNKYGKTTFFTPIPGFDIEIKTAQGWQLAKGDIPLSQVLAVRAKKEDRAGRTQLMTRH
ncbi:hexosaminidase [Pseudoalteromonas citrea]|uniref:beta-N-acetylhexosaminidase n=2 Tax=Pseudoalteromonas citrea TaxID=43655 RepID=A0AAD4AIK1_9GAMM|nr:family 20 glycosylhydrolase [Pseudoalteromonas citrea]KAF7771414.1 hexosaminidase [Pseudoalteromonas citrea]